MSDPEVRLSGLAEEQSGEALDEPVEHGEHEHNDEHADAEVGGPGEAFQTELDAQPVDSRAGSDESRCDDGDADGGEGRNQRELSTVRDEASEHATCHRRRFLYY